MCGGLGSRLDGDVEKPLVEVDSVPMVDRVVAALAGSPVDDVYAVTSPNAPATAAHVDVPVIETAGEGYVADLQAALADSRIEGPVLTVAADLPLLTPESVTAVLDRWDAGSLTVAVPVAFKRDLGASVDSSFTHEGREVAPSGLNVVGGEPGRVLVREDDRLAVNVNRPADLTLARRLA
ncbi:adenosylcobinamide-phosphate guanylyltransferase [Halomicrobium zhouii]|uniref:Adenosylcobinamide-phosphate guanylyltransferase n=1 Tax=Halomicrobium zhouii TaxID=767519 RepID=A0A1I6L7N1_9EURY|nr:NTP transferase domain-containing protein [Halomicrobium zhouii]SFR99434.1 adenosylcobinamide-phosphate guanylyltransferase [Halomicrobium zhouii]